MKSVIPIRTIAEVEKGVHIGQVRLDVAKLSLETETDVEFQFNNATWEVLLADLARAVHEVKTEKEDK